MQRNSYSLAFLILLSSTLPTQASFWDTAKDFLTKAWNNKKTWEAAKDYLTKAWDNKHVKNACIITGLTGLYQILNKKDSKEDALIVGAALTMQAYKKQIAEQIAKTAHPNDTGKQKETKKQIQDGANALGYAGLGYIFFTAFKKAKQNLTNKKQIFEIIEENKKLSDYASVPAEAFDTIDSYIQHFTMKDKVGLVPPRSFIILHGPGGTGKTSIMEHCSHYCREKLKEKGTKSVTIKVNASLFSEKYFGEAPQRIYELLYNTIKPFLEKNTHVQMLLDEAEGLLTNEEKEHSEQGRVLNIFKNATTEFAKLSEAVNKGALFIWGTTNNIEKVPQEIKESRCLSIKIGNPDENSRYYGFLNILKKRMDIYKHIPHLSRFLRYLSKNTPDQNFRPIKEDLVPALFQKPIFYNANENKIENAKNYYQQTIASPNNALNKKIQWFFNFQKTILAPIQELHEKIHNKSKNNADYTKLANLLKIAAFAPKKNQDTHKKIKAELKKTNQQLFDFNNNETQAFICNVVKQIVLNIYKKEYLQNSSTTMKNIDKDKAIKLIKDYRNDKKNINLGEMLTQNFIEKPKIIKNKQLVNNNNKKKNQFHGR